MDILNDITSTLSNYNWIIQVFLIIFVTLASNLFAKKSLLKLKFQLEKTQNIWDDAFIDAIHKPLSALIWVLGFTWAAYVVQSVSDAPIFAIIDPLKDISIIILITWFLINFVKNSESNLITKENNADDENPLDPSTIHALAKLIRLAIIITSSLVALQTLGFSISGVLAFGGIGGVAVGFASKDLLSNFFGGLMIYLDRPFAIGDWIRSPDKEIEGVVEYIGWRQTRIRTFDKRPLYIPNSTFGHISVENPSRMLNRRIYETIGVRYGDAFSLEKIVSDIKDMLKSHKDIDTTQALMVNVNTFAESSIDFFIYCLTKTTDWAEYHNVKQDVLFKILNIIEDNKAQIAYPTKVIELNSSLSESINKN